MLMDKQTDGKTDYKKWSLYVLLHRSNEEKVNMKSKYKKISPLVFTNKTKILDFEIKDTNPFV